MCKDMREEFPLGAYHHKNMDKDVRGDKPQ